MCTHAPTQCTPPHVICPLFQSVYNYTFPREVPGEVLDNCMPETISLLSAESCLFYRYGQKQWVKYVWALGLLAAGQSSTMTVRESCDSHVTVM